MPSRKLTENEVTILQNRQMWVSGLRDVEIPIVPNLDKKIWERVRRNSYSLDMDNWHSVDGQDIDIDDAHDRMWALGYSGDTPTPEKLVELVESCGTAHCRAGWAIHLAGEEGYHLEQTLHRAAAIGAAIYLVSEGFIPDFYDASNEDVIEEFQQRFGNED